jgi:regulatory protein
VKIPAVNDSGQTRTAVNAAIRLLARRSLTCREITERLAQKDYSEEEIAAAIERLLDYGYLDDQKLTRQFIQAYQERWSRLRLTQKLRYRGISEQDVRQCLAEIYSEETEQRNCRNEAEKLWQAERARWRRHDMAQVSHSLTQTRADLDREAKASAKIYKKLLQKGFDSNVVMPVMRQFRGKNDFQDG